MIFASVKSAYIWSLGERERLLYLWSLWSRPGERDLERLRERRPLSSETRWSTNTSY